MKYEAAMKHGTVLLTSNIFIVIHLYSKLATEANASALVLLVQQDFLMRMFLTCTGANKFHKSQAKL